MLEHLVILIGLSFEMNTTVSDGACKLPLVLKVGLALFHGEVGEVMVGLNLNDFVLWS